MKQIKDLDRITKRFLLAPGAAGLDDIDTPAFMRKEHGIELPTDSGSSKTNKVTPCGEALEIRRTGPVKSSVSIPFPAQF